MSAKKSSAIVQSTSSEGLHEGRNDELVGEVQIVSLLFNTFS
jgi:hypothetical protein